MSKNTWVTVVVVALVCGGGGFWGGMTYVQAQTPVRQSGASGANFSGRAGGARGFSGGAATAGTIISAGNGTFTVQLQVASSTGAASGSKIVLYDSSTQVQEMQSVPVSSLTTGKNVLVTGTPNSDGSITATMIQIRPAGAARPSAQ